MLLVKTFHRAFELGYSLEPDEVRLLDQEIRAWSHQTGSLITDLKVSTVPAGDRLEVIYTVLYRPAETVAPPASGAPPVETKDFPTVPTVIRWGGKDRAVRCMAGVFGVPRGWKLHPEDEEPAPETLLSPACVLDPYAELFGLRGQEEISDVSAQ
jgi:hypothetical protein